MKDNNIIHLTEPLKKLSTESNKRKISIYEQKTRYSANKSSILKEKTKILWFLQYYKSYCKLMSYKS